MYIKEWRFATQPVCTNLRVLLLVEPAPVLLSAWDILIRDRVRQCLASIVLGLRLATPGNWTLHPGRTHRFDDTGDRESGLLFYLAILVLLVVVPAPASAQAWIQS